MTATPILTRPNFDKPFVIKAYTSSGGIEVVLMQHNQLIAYMSRALGISKTTWSIYAKEMLAILESIHVCGLTY